MSEHAPPTTAQPPRQAPPSPEIAPGQPGQGAPAGHGEAHSEARPGEVRTDDPRAAARPGESGARSQPDQRGVAPPPPTSDHVQSMHGVLTEAPAGNLGTAIGTQGMPTRVGTPMPQQPAEVPPARVAATAGEVLTARDYNDYMLGRGGVTPGSGATAPANVHHAAMTVPLTQVGPVAFEAASVPAASLSKENAQVRARVMIASLQDWLAANPHEFTGIEAAVTNFFKELETRRLARITAGDLGREEPPDEIDDATSAPSPEYYQLSDVCDQALSLIAAYDDFLAGKGLEVPPEIVEISDGLKATATEIAAKFPPPETEEPPPEPPQVQEGWWMYDITTNEYRREPEQDWTTDQAKATVYTDEERDATPVPSDHPHAAYRPVGSQTLPPGDPGTPATPPA